MEVQHTPNELLYLDVKESTISDNFVSSIVLNIQIENESIYNVVIITKINDSEMIHSIKETKIINISSLSSTMRIDFVSSSYISQNYHSQNLLTIQNFIKSIGSEVFNQLALVKIENLIK